MRTSRRICVYCRAPGRQAVARWNHIGSFWVVQCEACDAIGPGAGSNFAAHEAFDTMAVGRHAEVLVRVK
jgi:hypothetical protein